MIDASLSTRSLLTVVITTSVTPSAPSTELVSSVLKSYESFCPALLGCRVIVVFDGYDRINAKERLKKGCVTQEQAQSYDIYKQNVKSVILDHYYPKADDVVFVAGSAEAEFGSAHDPQNVVPVTTTQTLDKSVTFIEPERRLGFGLALRSALRMTETPYVWVQQHDWVLASDFPIDHMLKIMQNSESEPELPVKYVCLPAVRMLSYATSAHVAEFPVLKEMTASLRRDFSAIPGSKIPLTPLFFWHDKPHVASVAHYLANVFPTRLAMLRGDFIEDKVGQRARAQMKEGLWTKWACWLYYPDDGKQLCLRHLQGRTWLGTEKSRERSAFLKEKNMAEARNAAEQVKEISAEEPDQNGSEKASDL